MSHDAVLMCAHKERIHLPSVFVYFFFFKVTKHEKLRFISYFFFFLESESTAQFFDKLKQLSFKKGERERTRSSFCFINHLSKRMYGRGPVHPFASFMI